MSDSDHYNTPESVLTPIRRYMGGIALDPCSNVASIVNAEVEWDIVERGEDGLSRPWHYLNAFTNPPYSPGNLAKWIKKCYDEYCLQDVLQRVMLLIPMSSGTSWWHDYAYTARWRLEYKGRIQFGDKMIVDPTSTNRHDSVLLCWEEMQRTSVIETFGHQGRIIFH